MESALPRTMARECDSAFGIPCSTCGRSPGLPDLPGEEKDFIVVIDGEEVLCPGSEPCTECLPERQNWLRTRSREWGPTKAEKYRPKRLCSICGGDRTLCVDTCGPLRTRLAEEKKEVRKAAEQARLLALCDVPGSGWHRCKLCGQEPTRSRYRICYVNDACLAEVQRQSETRRAPRKRAYVAKPKSESTVPCAVCQKPTVSASGICSRTKECLLAYDRWQKKKSYKPSSNPRAPTGPACGRCGTPTRSQYGVCATNADCLRERNRLAAIASHRRRFGSKPQKTLSHDDVRAIRAAYAAGGIAQRELAERYGVTQTTIGAVVRRQTFKDVG